MKRLSCFIMALALVLGLSQCKKQMSVTPNVAEQISITLNVDNGDGSKVDVVDGVVSFKQGDVIHVASHGTLRGTLTHNGTNFTGTISGAVSEEPLYFYFLGNKTISGGAGSEYIDIDDQTNELPVISMAASNQNYPATGQVYSATLSNKCALMKFNVTTPSNSPICITGMKNRVNINFGQYADDEANNGFSYDSHDGGVIKMAGGSGSPAVKWAIVLPQSAVGELENGVYTADNNYQGDRPAIRTIEMGKMYSSNPVALEVSTLNPEGPLSTPLTFEAKKVGSTVIFNKRSGTANLQYNKNGTGWADYTPGDAIELDEEDKVAFRAKGTNSAINTSSSSFNYFSCTGECYVYGNVMSLLDATNYATANTLSESYALAYLFCQMNTYTPNTTMYTKSDKVISLPATSLSDNCYEFMFYNCQKINIAPELPAEILTPSCYNNMFYNCYGLTSSPALPATTLANKCYNCMFKGCSGLTSAPTLPAETMQSECYSSMFYGCQKLTSAPELPATSLAQNCYSSMFYGCTGLTSTPELPATSLAQNCYSSMFQGCTKLSSAPTTLPAETMQSDCYSNMFYGCSQLTTSPELPATTLASKCYYQMFRGCTSLTTAPELPAVTMESECYSNMFYGCSQLTTSPELPATTLASKCYYQMFQNCTKLSLAPALPAETMQQECYSNMFYGCSKLTSAPELPATTLASSCYTAMFRNCTSLTTAPALPATTLNNYCYQYMFAGCTALNKTPDLNAPTLTRSCYERMFDGCSSVNSIKCLATDNSASNCTSYWLSGVAASGTFTKASSMESWTTGVNGIPSGWTVNNE